MVMRSKRIGGRGRAVGVLVGGLLLLSPARPAAAQPCVGDCRGLGQVGIADLILAVNIVLGLATADACPALGNAPIGISQLVTAVSNALCACRACPTRRFTLTPRPTSTPTATPTRDSVSAWHEDMLHVSESTCPSQVTAQIDANARNTTDDYIIRENGNQATIENDSGVLPGTVDPDGTFRATDTSVQQQGTCVVNTRLDLSVNLRTNPSEARYAAAIAARGCAINANCNLQIVGRWTRISGVRRSASSLQEAVRRAFVSP